MTRKAEIEAVLAAMGETRLALDAQHGVLARLEARLQDMTLRLSGADGMGDAPGTVVTVAGDGATAHRRAHRPGLPARLDADPELRAFVLARVDSLTYAELAAAVAEHFPRSRCVGRSAIHSWWSARRKAMQDKAAHPG